MGKCVQLLGGAKIIVRLAIMMKITRIFSQSQCPVRSACDSEVAAALYYYLKQTRNRLASSHCIITVPWAREVELYHGSSMLVFLPCAGAAMGGLPPPGDLRPWGQGAAPTGPDLIIHSVTVLQVAGLAHAASVRCTKNVHPLLLLPV